MLRPHAAARGVPGMRSSARFAKERFWATQGAVVKRRAYSTTSIWLGLFAMLMIHVGPLYSALQIAGRHAEPSMAAEHAGHGGHSMHAQAGHDPNASVHHRQARYGEPRWLAALELCGYCELLTLNPPLTLAVDLALPEHRPAHFEPLPVAPLVEAPRHSRGHPRAPPVFHA